MSVECSYSRSLGQFVYGPVNLQTLTTDVESTVGLRNTALTTAKDKVKEIKASTFSPEGFLNIITGNADKGTLVAAIGATGMLAKKTWKKGDDTERVLVSIIVVLMLAAIVINVYVRNKEKSNTDDKIVADDDVYYKDILLNQSLLLKAIMFSINRFGISLTVDEGEQILNTLSATLQDKKPEVLPNTIPTLVGQYLGKIRTLKNANGNNEEWQTLRDSIIADFLPFLNYWNEILKGAIPSHNTLLANHSIQEV